MGLIKAFGAAVGGTLADSYKDAMHCDLLDNKTIACPGTRLRSGSERNTNVKGESNIISNGSAILVEENTCMLTIDNGKITNVVTEPGKYILDNSSAPSIFAGNIGASFKDLISRVAYGGTPSNEQRVIYINLQKLPGIQFGTGTPVPYPDPRYNTTVELRFYGTFEVQIPDAECAVRFYHEVMGKGTRSSYRLTVDEVFRNDQYKHEFMQHLMEALNMLSAEGFSYNQITSQLTNLANKTKTASESTWVTRGFIIQNIGMGPITISDETKELLKDRLKADTMIDPSVQQAMMASSVARGIEAAGSNEGGAMMGFMGMNMAMNAGSNVLGSIPNNNAGGAAPYPYPQSAFNNQQPSETPAADSWTCACGTVSTGGFCSNCGTKKPEPKTEDTWKCTCGTDNAGKFCIECGAGKTGAAPAASTWKCTCGAENTAKFCMECGAKKPTAPKKYKCDKCGFVPEDPTNPPKFCPECGDPFNDSDAE